MAAIVSDPQFAKFSQNAKLVWFTLRHSEHRHPSNIWEVPLFFDVGRLAQLPPTQTESALEELQNARWLALEGNVLWLTKGRQRRVTGLQAHLRGLPRLFIVRRYCEAHRVPPTDDLPAEPGPSCSSWLRYVTKPLFNMRKRQPPKSTFFTKFWKSYPPKRKWDRYRCESLWESRKLDQNAEKILRSLEMWKQSEQWLKEDGDFVPNPYKWLKFRRYMDDVTELGPQECQFCGNYPLPPGVTTCSYCKDSKRQHLSLVR